MTRRVLFVNNFELVSIERVSNALDTSTFEFDAPALGHLMKQSLYEGC